MPGLLLKTAERVARLLPAPLRRGVYRLGPVTRLVRRALNRAAPHGLTQVQAAAGAAAGLTFELDLQSEKDYWLGSYETDLQEVLPHFLRPGMVIFDVGANIGYLTMIFARSTGAQGRVYAFEALPANVRRLQSHVEMNGFTDRVRIMHHAVVDRAGPVTFLVHPSHGMGKAAGSAGRDGDYPGQIEVEGTSIDEVVFSEGVGHPDLIKMDIEGGEVLALRGMPRTLAELRPVVLLELHGEEAARAAWECFEEAGYTLHRMETELSRIRTIGELDWKAYIIALPGQAA